MSHSLPDHRDGADLHQEPEEAREDDGQFGQVIAVNIDGGEQTDHGSGAHPRSPVPLPSPPDGKEALLGREVELSVLVKAHEGEDQGDAEQNGKADGDTGAHADLLDGRVTPCDIKEGAVREDVGGLPRVEGQDAPRAIGQGAVGVERVVPVFKGCAVEVVVADQRVARVIAAGEGDDIAGVQQRHIGPVRTDLDGARPGPLLSTDGRTSRESATIKRLQLAQAVAGRFNALQASVRSRLSQRKQKTGNGDTARDKIESAQNSDWRVVFFVSRRDGSRTPLLPKGC